MLSHHTEFICKIKLLKQRFVFYVQSVAQAVEKHWCGSYYVYCSLKGFWDQSICAQKAALLS